MSTRLKRKRSVFVIAAVVSVLGFGAGSTAGAITVEYVTDTTPADAALVKAAWVRCPKGMAVLGGEGKVNGATGQVAIQAAFPVDEGGVGYIFVVHAAADPSATNEVWSLTAGAYCTPDTVPIYLEESSAFNGDPIKSVTVMCPQGTRVVGMGGEVSSDVRPWWKIPDTRIVFQGFEVNAKLTQVTARATELQGAFGGMAVGPWMVTAMVSCSNPGALPGLEVMSNTELGGGLLPFETESLLYIGCSSKNKRIIAAGSTIDDNDMGQWYLDRFSLYNTVQNRIYAQADRNPELGVSLVTQAAHVLCIDK